jgi:hypothetical protein
VMTMVLTGVGKFMVGRYRRAERKMSGLGFYSMDLIRYILFLKIYTRLQK